MCDVQDPSRYAVVLEAGDLSTGVYFVRLQAKGASLTRRLVLVK